MLRFYFTQKYFVIESNVIMTVSTDLLPSVSVATASNTFKIPIEDLTAILPFLEIKPFAMYSVHSMLIIQIWL